MDAFAAAIRMGEEYMRDTKALLLRINLMRADFVVKGSGEGPGPRVGARVPAFQSSVKAEGALMMKKPVTASG